MSFNSQKNRGTSVFRRKDAPIAPGNGFDHNKKRMNASNPPTAPRSFQDAPGINSGYNKKRNNWSDSSAAPGASSALGGSSTAPGRPYIASGNSTTAPGGFNGAPGTNFDYNKIRNNRSNGNQRNQVPYQNRNQNTGYNNKRNNGPNNGVRSGNISRNNGPYRGNQYQNQQWNNQRANQGRQRLSSQNQHQDVDMDRLSNFNQGNQKFNRGGYNQRGGRQNVNFNNVVSTNLYPDDEDEDMSGDKYDSDDEYDTEDEDMSEDESESKDEPEYKYKQTNSNNFKQPKKFQRLFRDIGIDTEMTDAPSDEPVRLNLTPFFRYNPNLTTFFGHPSIRFTDHYQSDIEMVDAPALITDPRIKAFAEGAQALQHIAQKMTILAGQLDPSVLLDYNCTA
ncbi:hypothetical protein PENARI_c004G02684 [Penicillium arizonense]|uniref:Uncharacterized protein n=1 Tax=Penicillium arizonense TaxID=1835702 RepID=A0A1F5LQ74_PENAI|nr:hypothetical protein PENARI_c004G02684 [Penicillium arizonense]OGE55277.1 hypothetical protein PENARI_c004G02684 [Penicillium arizonense]